MKLKKIVNGQVLQDKMKEAILLLSDTVKSTLGPIGSNTIIDHSTFSPFITNDGVTIAKNIESEDAVVNTILEIAKEAAIKTDETVGDGTTTTLVLLESIFLEGLEKIKNGKKAMQLKRELDEALSQIINLIKAKSQIPKKEDYLKIATISANDKQIGSIVANVFNKVKDPDAIELIDNNNPDTLVIYQQGYRFETLLASPYFLNTSKIVYINCTILLVNQEINSLEVIAPVLNQVIENDQPLIIIAPDYSEEVINSILSWYLDETAKIILFKNPEYGKHSYAFLEDLAILANSTIVQNINNDNQLSLGTIERVEITNDQTIFNFTLNNDIKSYIKNLKKESKKNMNDLDYQFYKKRISMFTKGRALIKIGGYTKTEIREKHMRYQDALCSLNVAKKGILPGGGITLLEIQEQLSNQTDGLEILKNALNKPFRQILQNADLDDQEIFMEIKNNHFQKIYNVYQNNYENINETSVLDSTEVLLNSVINACSIASMLLTTSNLVINECQNNLNKQNEYTEF